MIRLIDALNLMDQKNKEGEPIPFSIKYVTFNRKKKTGGEIIAIEKAPKCVGTRKGKIIHDKKESTNQRRPPNHFKNSTRNLNILNTDQIRKCNINPERQ